MTNDPQTHDGLAKNGLAKDGLAKDGADLPDYDAIFAAVSETPRGRWFLAEYQRRNRAADTATVLDQIARLEAMVVRHDPELARARLSSALDDLATILALAPDGSGDSASADGLTGEMVSSIALSLGQAGEEAREAVLTARGAVLSLRENPTALRFFDALQRQLKTIDAQMAAMQLASRRVEALAQVITVLRERLRTLLQDNAPVTDTARPQHGPQESKQDIRQEIPQETSQESKDRAAVEAIWPAAPQAERRDAPALSPSAPEPRAPALHPVFSAVQETPATQPEPRPEAAAPAEPAAPLPAFEQVWHIPAAAPESPLRHVATLMQDRDETDAADDPLVALHAQSAPPAHASRTLADLDRMSYTERAALFA
ncbi:MAG: hypothetical protein ACRCUX_08545 [Beijerinckiaceae bacterium]